MVGSPQYGQRNFRWNAISNATGRRGLPSHTAACWCREQRSGNNGRATHSGQRARLAMNNHTSDKTPNINTPNSQITNHSCRSATLAAINHPAAAIQPHHNPSNNHAEKTKRTTSDLERKACIATGGQG